MAMQEQVNATAVAHRRVPWNMGKLMGAKPPLRPKHVWSIGWVLPRKRLSPPIGFIDDDALFMAIVIWHRRP
jgi:hypothetical protein